MGGSKIAKFDIFYDYESYSLTCPLLMHSLNVEVGRTVGVGADQDPGLGKMQTQQFDALLQRACLATPKRTEHQRWDLNIKTILVSHNNILSLLYHPILITKTVTRESSLM